MLAGETGNFKSDEALKAISGSAVVYCCIGLKYDYFTWRQQWLRSESAGCRPKTSVRLAATFARTMAQTLILP